MQAHCRAGASALVVAPLLAITGIAITPTVNEPRQGGRASDGQHCARRDRAGRGPTHS